MAVQRRDLRAPARSPQDNARLAAVTQDDIDGARQRLRSHSERLSRILDADEIETTNDSA